MAIPPVTAFMETAALYAVITDDMEAARHPLYLRSDLTPRPWSPA